jgi:hypothetical protein
MVTYLLLMSFFLLFVFVCGSASVGVPILTREQIQWFFDELVGIPMRREVRYQKSYNNHRMLCMVIHFAGGYCC